MNDIDEDFEGFEDFEFPFTQPEQVPLVNDVGQDHPDLNEFLHSFPSAKAYSDRIIISFFSKILFLMSQIFLPVS